VIAAAAKYGCRGIGFDIDPERVREARENVKRQGVEHLVRIEQRDIFAVDLQEAEVVLMYLLPWMVTKLAPQLDAMPGGSRVVSHEFWIAGVRPDERVDVPGTSGASAPLLFLYRTPLRHDPAVTLNDGPPEPR
jgi:hypothetical protein